MLNEQRMLAYRKNKDSKKSSGIATGYKLYEFRHNLVHEIPMLATSVAIRYELDGVLDEARAYGEQLRGNPYGALRLRLLDALPLIFQIFSTKAPTR